MDRRRFIRNSLSAAVAASLPLGSVWASLRHSPTEVGAAITALSGDGTQLTLKRAEVQELSDALKGKLLLPGTEGYDEARLLLNPVICWTQFSAGPGYRFINCMWRFNGFTMCLRTPTLRAI